MHMNNRPLYEIEGPEASIRAAPGLQGNDRERRGNDPPVYPWHEEHVFQRDSTVDAGQRRFEGQQEKAEEELENGNMRDRKELYLKVESAMKAAMETMDMLKNMKVEGLHGLDADVALDGNQLAGDTNVELNKRVPRLHDSPVGGDSKESIPGVEDLHEELKQYNNRMLESFTFDDQVALSRQERRTAKELGLKVMDAMDEIESIPNRIQFLNNLFQELETYDNGARIAIASTVSVDVWGLRREILPWISYMQEIGIRKFYLLYDGSDSDAVRWLEKIDSVELIHIHSPFASEMDEAVWRSYSNHTRQWSGKPGNYQLMFKQGFCQEEALRRAKLTLHSDAEVNVRSKPLNWILHLDPDELILPGDPEGSLIGELERLPAWIPSIRFMNFEAQYEAGGMENRFEQATLFRAHKHFITPEAFAHRSRYKLGNNSAFLNVYANGKSAVRIDAPGVRSSGPHFWRGSQSERWKSPKNPRGLWENHVSDTTVVLHYAYAYEREVEAKAKRSCPESYRDLVLKGDIDRVKEECFVVSLCFVFLWKCTYSNIAA